MNVRWLVRYVSGVCALLAVMTSCMTYHADIQYVAIVLPTAFFVVAGCGILLDVFLGRLPLTHWVHQSKPIRVGLSLVAIMATLMLILVG